MKVNAEVIPIVWLKLLTAKVNEGTATMMDFMIQGFKVAAACLAFVVLGSLTIAYVANQVLIHYYGG